MSRPKPSPARRARRQGQEQTARPARPEPDDPDLDEFACGTSPEAKEVSEYFRSRRWFDHARRQARPPVYQFGTRDVIIWYAAVAFANRPHPDNLAALKARYLVIYVLGVHDAHQGKANPLSPIAGERYATTVMRALDEHLSRQKPDCVGLYLHVRQGNDRAIQFYRRLGFVDDPVGPIAPAEGGTPQLVMRKLHDGPRSG